jgi:uncharacterized protein (TIGR00297 family)
MSSIINVIIALLVMLPIGYISLVKKWLSRVGALTALIMGLILIFFGGWTCLIVVLSFYVLSSYFTMYRFELKASKSAAQKTRSWRNVMANGIVATFFTIAEGIYGGEAFLGGFIGAISTATADTLATEIGLLYPGEPRLITNLKRKVQPGTSGAVSPLGEFGAVLGVLVIGLVFMISRPLDGQLVSSFNILILSCITGIVGTTVDSILGVTIQAQYFCFKCNCITEESKHTCGFRSKLIHGYSFFSNDIVNITSTLTGGLLGFILTYFIPLS